MLIPSIDLMNGKIVQLVQGSRKALEFDDFGEWVDRFSKYPLVQLIDLDAAMGRGNNRDLVRKFSRQLPCQVGGGIRTIEAARSILESGARRVILGSSLISKGAIHVAFAQDAATEIGPEKLVFAADCRGGHVAIKGWQETTGITAVDMMRALESCCSAFLYTHIDSEGLLRGIPLDVVRELRGATSRQLIAAGGIRSHEEVAALDALGVDAVVGMAIYMGLMPA
ncbi:MAG TPA: 1-(5-phosphoribosyl)-5-[(5-phosphoribosylamino)methylideneamino] imidazole-4-carboxamide isomerase [Candidatus Sulfotelmatobacter sp.]|nr:1-(5-phosphoribosyl)-5-[(5-phosphoribosylamino)methylideneamino] imidazole-4-carboxamide isomerase [Candidatus Sulfotelmatobacter sp.]